ncbi:TonB-dependent receptor [Niabella insulamsoli]|uniref:SusC/RagA family TonB-linked outer membrane protein n=1 Tax=Niabella insulamsoli TaxID=3144874 RepID=UPI0031FCE003
MKKSIKKGWLVLTACFTFLGSVDAQRTVTGTVSDEAGTAIRGASVMVSGSNQGTSTNADGHYSIQVFNPTDSIVFSFVGKRTKSYVALQHRVINVTLIADAENLDDVVVVGYGTVRKSDLTGSVARVKTDLTEQRFVNTPEELLQGATPGVQITRMGGAPGSDVNVTIRGGNSLNGSNQPLFIVDGLEMNGSSSYFSSDEPSGSTPAPSPLSMINPNDIESIDVLKDASATAIYGARGANGVIIITTKKGKKGKAIIQADYGATFASLAKKIDVINSKQWVLLYDEASLNGGKEPTYGDPSDPASYDKYTKNVNWQDLMYRNAKGRDLNLSIRGGTEAIKYAFAANYNLTEGLIINSDQERISLRSNFDVKATDFLTIGLDGFYSNTMSNIVPYSNNGYNGFFSPIMMGVQYRAFDNAWNEDFDINPDDFVDDGSAPYNPVAQIRNTQDEQRLNFAQSNLYTELRFTDWLKFRSTFGFNYGDGLRNSFWGRGTQQGDIQNNIISRVQTSNLDYINENTLNIEKTFAGKHRLTAVVGQSSHKWIRKTFATKASGFDITALGYESFDGATIVEVPRSTHTEWGLASFYGRINYAYNDKYLLTVTGRYDGSSRFAPGNKWSFFPSAAFAWKLKNEAFLENAQALSDLKLRLSYGSSGSQAIGVLSTIATLLRGYRYPVSDEFLPGVSSSSYLFNKNLKWETTYQANAGIDVGFFKGRLNLTADYYQKNTRDLLLDKDFPISGGFTSTTVNAGEVRNRGWELALNGDIIRNKDFKWNLGTSFSQNRSKILDLDGAAYMYGTSIANIQGGYPNISYVNQTVGLFYGYQTAGIYQHADQTVGAPTKSGVAPQAGDIIFVDQLTPTTQQDGSVVWEKDGVINESDKVIIGNPEPDLIYGITSNLQFKGVNISMVFNGIMGNDLLNLNNLVWEGMNLWDGRYSQTLRAFEGRWTSDNTNALYPRSTLGTVSQDYLDRYVEPGDFFRMQNLSVSYTLNPKKLKVLRSVRPFASVSNLFILSKYSGYDPEIRGRNTALSPGIDLGAYPMPRTFKLGVTIILN